MAVLSGINGQQNYSRVNLPRVPYGSAEFDANALGLNLRGNDNAPQMLANSHRPAPQVRIGLLFDRGKIGVHIQMEDNFAHGIIYLICQSFSSPTLLPFSSAG